MLDATASGVYVIAVTPFHDDGRLDDGAHRPRRSGLPAARLARHDARAKVPG